MDDKIVESYPKGSLKSEKHSLLIRPYLFGQFRLQLTNADMPDAHAPEGHGSIVREICTYNQKLALSTAEKIINADDPEAFCKTLEKPWNCENPGLGRIRLDNPDDTK